MHASKHGVDDMVMLSKISNDGINENLKKRYTNDVIYTYIGHVLISVNPFKEIKGIYTDKTLKEYRGKYRYELPPHVYALADDMYRSMASERENQCVIISGESGAGKTEASKKIMQFLAAVSGNSPNVQHVKDVILESNPLLEAFGNAKTLRNNNSSRFGKYMEIQFDLAGDPEGGRINNYLLEKSRVIYQTPGERTFHIFYQLLACGDASMQSELGLSSPDYFHYLNQSRCYQVEGIDDRAEWQDTVKAMNVMGITPQEQQEVFRLLAGILYLGNIEFAANEKDEAYITDQQVVEMFAYLIQSDVASCSKALCYRTISTGTQGRSARVSTYACPQNAEGAYYSRDALAKALYSRLFDWIIGRVNQALGWINDNDCLLIGILDIYGFEIFEKNGFEQFCINYVNEKLQQIFIELTLKAEQEEYGKEGIKWEHIDFFNNKICCDLIESKRPIGILAVLDDTCNFPKGTDDKFLQKLVESYRDHAHFAPGMGQGEFVIKHYAGDVSYNADGFCDKNRDLLFNDLIDLAHCTSSKLVQSLFPEAKTAADKRRPSSAGFKIKESINLLVDALTRCHPHYIRCIKPNEKKRANDYNGDMCMHQVKYLGLLENVRVRRAGYAYRQVYDKFFFRYRVCSSETWPNWNGDYQAGTEAILRVLNLEPGQFQKGHTKVFIRAPETLFALEELRERKVHTYANQIQRFFMRFSLNTYFYDLQMSANKQLQNKKQRRRNSIEREFSGDYLNYRENFTLKAVIEAGGKEKHAFSDRCNKYTRSLKKRRRVIVVTNQALYVVAVEKNKDKDKVARAKKPWVYTVKLRAEFNRIKGITFSSMADNFFVLHLGDQDNLLENRRKTELLSVLLKYIPSLQVRFSDTIEYLVKKGKKKNMIQFVQDPLGGSGKPKGKKLLVAPDLPATTVPNIKAPAVVPTVHVDPYSDLRGGGGGAPRGGGAPGSRGVPRGRGGNPTPPSRGGGPAPPAFRAPAPTPEPEPEPEAEPQQQCKALYDFDAENPDELTFKSGDIINFIEDLGEWWKGEINGQSGIFPATYVEMIKAAPKAVARPSPGRGAPTPMARGGPTPPARGGPTPGRGAARGGPSPPSPAPAPTPAPAPGRGPVAARGAPPGRLPTPGGPAPGRGAPPGGTGAPTPGRLAARGAPPPMMMFGAPPPRGGRGGGY